jgi:hypothetical protein
MRTRHGAKVAALFFWMVLPCAAQIENGTYYIVGIVNDAASHQPLAGRSH